MRIFRIVVFSILLSGLCAASEPADSLHVQYRMNPVIVTASKIAHSQRDIAASISLIPLDLIRTAPTSAVLELAQITVPGLHVTEWGVMGFGAAGQAAGKISIRGMGGGANTHVLILRNGRPDFMGLMGCTIGDEFSTEGVERIEVIRGPGSFLYGTNATGGIINIISRQLQEDGFETRLRGSAGSFGIRTLGLEHGGKLGAWNYYLTAGSRQTEGHREESEYKSDQFSAHFGAELKNSTLEFNASLADIHLLDPGPKDAAYTDHWYDMLRFGGDISLTNRNRLGESNLKIHSNYGDHAFYDGWRSHDRTLGAMFTHTAKPIRGQLLIFGFDWKRYGGNARDAAVDYEPVYLTEYAPYLYAQQLLWGRLIASAGIRMEVHTLYGKEILPKLGLVFHPWTTSSLRLSLSKGFRSPSIRELYFWAPANEDLTPDRVWNAEAGWMQNWGRLKFEGAVFRGVGENLIQFSGPPPRWVNGGEYDHAGYELSLEWLSNRILELGGTWSQMALSEDCYNIPEKKLTLYANCSLGRFRFTAHGLLVSGLRGAEFSGPSPVPILHDMEDYGLLHLSCSCMVLRNWHVSVWMKNATDSKYESMYGYPMPGRTLMVETEMEISR